jgi:hypothetical protein
VTTSPIDASLLFHTFPVHVNVNMLINVLRICCSQAWSSCRPSTFRETLALSYAKEDSVFHPIQRKSKALCQPSAKHVTYRLAKFISTQVNWVIWCFRHHALFHHISKSCKILSLFTCFSSSYSKPFGYLS